MKQRRSNKASQVNRRLENKLMKLELKLQEEALDLDKNRKATYID
jgi:hypothetical protein